MPPGRRVDRHTPVWLFDLDNTLHNASPHIFPHINRSMTEYVARELGLGEEDASRLRVAYWKRYGATLLGLVRHHGVDPHHFLHHTHQFPTLNRMVVAEPALRHSLRRLPGRKIVFSNAPLAYALAVLRTLGIRRLFDTVFSIESAGFVPKPDIAAFRTLLRSCRVRAERCVMVEDSAENLRTAKRLGMRTVLISNSAATPAYVDLRLQSVLDLPRHLGRFQ